MRFCDLSVGDIFYISNEKFMKINENTGKVLWSTKTKIGAFRNFDLNESVIVKG